VDSLGEKAQFETAGANFVVFQSMPKKEFLNKERTLAEEGLFPRAML
jgi:hypothetical protein